MQSSYEALQQRRERIEATMWLRPDTNQHERAAAYRCIRALLDDADCGPALAEMPTGATLAIEVLLERYDRALSIAEKELGL